MTLAEELREIGAQLAYKAANEIERLQQKVQNLMDDLAASEDDLADATEKSDEPS